MCSSMVVAMMQVRIVRMGVDHRFMPMRVRMRLYPVPIEIMAMLVVGVMRVTMSVIQALVRVFMLMPLTDVQPDTECHQSSGNPEP